MKTHYTLVKYIFQKKSHVGSEALVEKKVL